MNAVQHWEAYFPKHGHTMASHFGSIANMEPDAIEERHRSIVAKEQARDARDALLYDTQMIDGRLVVTRKGAA